MVLYFLAGANAGTCVWPGKATTCRVLLLPADIRTALKAKDEDYVKLLKRQAADVDAMLAAMGRQLSEMTAAYREELEAVEGVLMQVCVAHSSCCAAVRVCRCCHSRQACNSTTNHNLDWLQ